MIRALVRILVVDDFEPFRSMVSSMLGKQPGLEVVGLVSDGQKAVQQAEELQPDLIILDISLPSLNGIEAARQIRVVSPGSIILFLSANSSPEVALEALRTGARGYVLKAEVETELLVAVHAVLRGNRFMSGGVTRNGLAR